MNKNKIIFAILGILLLVLFIFLLLNFNKKAANTNISRSGELVVWLLGDESEGFKKVFDEFKKSSKEYEGKTIKIESFASYDDYFYTLNSAIISGKSPDIFVLNNNEKKSTFTEQVVGINPNIVNPNDFRKKFKGVFADDLIMSSGEGEQKTEFLVGIPVGYEALGIYFNRKYVKESELSSISSLNNLVAKIKESKPEITPIGIGNGFSVFGVSDILTQFLMLESDVSGLKDVTGDKMKQGLASYMLYGDISGDNAYNERIEEMNKSGENSLDLFSKGDTFMLVGYPRLLEQINKKGFSKNFLLASVFPQYVNGKGKALINYNYFVINKESKNQDVASKFLGYLASDKGAKQYLDNYKYYLPALLSLESDKLEEKVNSAYNIVLGNFYSSDYDLSSFDKGIKTIYDEGIISILDNVSGYQKDFDNFRDSIVCKAEKLATLDGLSKSCVK